MKEKAFVDALLCELDKVIALMSEVREGIISPPQSLRDKGYDDFSIRMHLIRLLARQWPSQTPGPIEKLDKACALICEQWIYDRYDAPKECRRLRRRTNV